MKYILPALAVSIGVPAWGQPLTHTQDSFDMRRHSADHATLTYHNGWPPSSMGAPLQMTEGDLTIYLHLRSGQGPETLEVVPPEGWVAIPPMLDVIDGQTGTFEIRRGKYLGF